MTTTVHKTTLEAGLQITRAGHHWGTWLGAAAGPISFGFRTSAAPYSVAGSDISGFSILSPAEQAAARAALGSWAEAANISFLDLGYSNDATIEFANYYDPSDGAGAFAFFPGSTSATAAAGDVFLNLAFVSTTSLPPGSYSYFVFVHEIGHALGLEHPGAYNAAPGVAITYGNNAEYIEDTHKYSVMSYFDESYTGAYYSGYPVTPQLHDIAAIQHLYGANMATRTGNTTYGFNSNAGSAYSIGSSWQLARFTVWDAGGTDTFDFSGYPQDQTIDLAAEGFSDVGGLTGNVAIALGATIEAAIGGSGNDTITGNSVANILTGGLGNDTIDGGPGTDSAIFSGNRSAYVLTAVAGGGVQVSGTDGTDTLTHVERLVFADGTVTWPEPVGNPATLGFDFNADGFSDILWQNTNGQVRISELNGTDIIGGGTLGNDPGPSWKVIDSGDFNGDGKSDILFQHTDGSVGIWEMDGTNVIGWATLGYNPGPSWKVIDSGDFNGDSKADILFQHTDGWVALWEMQGTSAVGGGTLGYNPGASWQVKAIGGYNSDGKSDMLLQHADGWVAIWEVDGTTTIGGGALAYNPGTSWQVKGSGDFNGDRVSDILLQHTDGWVAIWEMDGTSAIGGGVLAYNPGPSWQVKAIGDTNGDGKSDIALQHIDGWVALWELDGTQVIDSSATIVASADSSWIIV
jgi:hypothetical protein